MALLSLVPTPAELAANLFVTASIVLAARNSIHVWWTGIVGCAVFAWVFADAKLYSDAILQAFFIAASIGGWWNWARGEQGAPPPIRWTPPARLAAWTATSVAFACAWAWLVARYTDAASPLADSFVLGLSVLAQLLMMGRRVENWVVWIVVNTIAVPLFWSRGLHLTAGLYAFYWMNAWWALFHWKRLAVRR
jgi:nicotinamide mononucleotide transporter